MSAQPYQTWTLLTNEELRSGAADYQSAAAYAHAEAVKALARGLPDYASEWQKVQAFHHSGAARADALPIAEVRTRAGRRRAIVAASRALLPENDEESAS
jgi:hypothetical protein